MIHEKILKQKSRHTVLIIVLAAVWHSLHVLASTGAHGMGRGGPLPTTAKQLGSFILFNVVPMNLPMMTMRLMGRLLAWKMPSCLSCEDNRLLIIREKQ
jgi:hypothetical protein